ncbi:PA14 domain-containing protein [Dokdonia sp. Hel_I_53]|uniref:PA14 domain-containing protein n=1 Tax=Dokdonia sp. Hel_I_53 TaxID=1566287 RepID=UPI00119D4441|nr:PA14 domain-containing protein [Dokdonia sp. Hel_I_53]
MRKITLNTFLIKPLLVVLFFLAQVSGTAQTTRATYEDQFNTVSYLNDDGVIPFSSQWFEDNENTNPQTDPTTGRIQVVGGQLRFRNLDDRSIYRFLDLSWVPPTATVTLTFDYDALNRGNEGIDVWLFNNSTGNYDLVSAINTNTTGSRSITLTPGQISSNSEIWFFPDDTNWQNNDEIFIDNVKFTITDTEQDACASVPASISNPDGDAVSEVCTNTYDLDEDNDGILDSDEFGICNNSSSVLDWSANYTSGGAARQLGDDPVVVNPTATADGVNVYLSRTVSSNIDGFVYKINDEYSSGAYTLFQEAKNGGSSSHTFEFSQPVYNLGFTVFDVDRDAGNTTFIDEIRIILTEHDGSTHTLSAAEYTTNGQTYTSPNTFEGTTASLNQSFSLNGVQAWISKMEIIYSNLSTAPASRQNQAAAISDFTFCKAVDTDGDGTPDYLDTDSDNDGCADAVEANGNFTTSDLTSSNNLADTNEGTVNSNGVPTNTGSPQTTNSDVITNGPDADNDGIADACDPFVDMDSDQDGVFDIADLDDDNDGILDTEELSCNESLTYEYYDGTPSGNTVNNIPSSGADETGTFPSLDVDALIASIGATNDTYGLRFKGYFNITTAGTYTFYLSSDDGSKLSIDSAQIVINDGLHAVTTVAGNKYLEAGLHAIEILFFENTGGESLQVEYELPSTIARQNVPFSNLYCFLDSDNDGTPDHLDTDSDNDGCPDAVEGDENVQLSQLSAERIPGAVDADGVPNAVNSGGASDVGGDQGQGSTSDVITPLNAGVLSGGSEVCVEDTLQLSSNGDAGGSWSSSDDAIATINSSGLVSGIDAGSVTITYTVGSGGCEDSSTIDILVNALPTAATVSSNSPVCSGDAAVFTIGGDAGDVVSYTIDGGAVTTATIEADGDVDVTITGVTIDTRIDLTNVNDGTCDRDLTVSTTVTVNTLPAVPTVVVTSEDCTQDASNVVSNYDTNLTYSSTPAGLVVGAGGVITGGTTGTSYTITAENAATCESVSSSFTYDGDTQLAAPVVPTVVVTSEDCTQDASNVVSNYDTNLTYSSTPAGLVVGAGGVITGGTTGTSYTITAENAATCESVSSSFTYDGDTQLAAPAVPTVVVTSEDCTQDASNVVSNYDTNLTYSSTPAGLVVGAGGVITGGTTDTSYTITAENAATCESVSSSFTYDGDTQLAAPAVPTVVVTSEDCTQDASNVVSNYDTNLTYSSTPTGLVVGAGGVITGGTTGTSYTITAENAATCESVSSSFTYDGDTQLAAPAVPTVVVTSEDCTQDASNVVSNYDANLTYSSTPTGLVVGAGGVITGGTTGTSYTITAENAATCESVSSSFTYDGDTQLAAPAVPTVVVTSEDCTQDASNVVSNYDANLTYSSTPTGLVVGAGGVITGGTTGTSYTITAENAATCESVSSSFTYDGDTQLAAPAVPTVVVTSEDCTQDASNVVSNYDTNLTYSSTPAGLVVGAGGVITGGTTGTSYTITAENAATCESVSSSFTYDGDTQLAAPAVPTVVVTSEDCTQDASNVVSNYDANLTYSSTPTGLVVGAGGVITGGTTGTSYTITAENAATCESVSSSFTYDGDTQLAAPAVPTVVVTSEDCTQDASNVVSNYDTNLTYSSTPTGLVVGAGGVITGGTTGTSYTITAENAATCESVSSSFTYDGDTQLAAPAVPTVVVTSEDCTQDASNVVSNYDANLTYSSTPTGLVVGAGGVITGGTTGTSYTITAENAATCESVSSSFTYDGDTQLAAPAVPTVVVTSEDCTQDASNVVSNYDANLTYSSTPTGLVVGAGGVITGGTTGTSYTITAENAATCESVSSSFTYDGDTQLAAPAVPTVVVTSEDCTQDASNVVSNYDTNLTYSSTPTGLVVGAGGVITGGTTGTSYTITAENAATCESVSSSFTYDGDTQLAAPAVPTVVVTSEDCTQDASNVVSNYDTNLTYSSTPTGLVVGAGGVITGGTTGTSYTITAENAATCESVSSSFTYDGDTQLAAPAVPTVVVTSEDCTQDASNVVSNYDANLTYSSTPTGLVVGAGGVITGGTTGTSYTITAENAATCESVSSSFTYDGDTQLAAPAVPTVVVTSEDCTQDASNVVSNYDTNLTYSSTPTGLVVGAGGVITGGTTGTSYTITAENAATCESVSSSFTYDGDTQLAAPAVPTVVVTSEDCTQDASNVVSNYDANLTYSSTPTGLVVGAGGVITGGTTGTSYTITAENAATCESVSSSFTYDGDTQLAAPAVPTVVVTSEDCTQDASNVVSNYDANLTYSSTPTGLVVGAGGVITGGTTGTSYTITAENAATCESVSSSFTYDGDTQLAAPAVPTVVVTSEDCTQDASNVVSNYDANLTYSSTPTGLVVGAGGVITGGTTGTSYTITAENAATCESVSSSFTYDGDTQLAAPAVPTVVVTSEDCTQDASNVVSNYDANLTYSSTPTGLVVGAGGVITGGTTGTSYTITAENAATCESVSSSFTYDGDTQLAAPAVPTVVVTSEDCTQDASNVVSNYDTNLTYSSTPTGLVVGAGGVITGGTTGTSYTITAENAATCESVSSSFTYDGDTQLAAPAVPTVVVTSEDCTQDASNVVSNYDANLTYSSTPTGLVVGAGGVITGGTTGTSYTITAENAATCESVSSSFTYDGDTQLAAPAVPTVVVTSEDCTQDASNVVSNYDTNLTYSSTPSRISCRCWRSNYRRYYRYILYDYS